jgi:hypothetical protein
MTRLNPEFLCLNVASKPGRVKPEIATLSAMGETQNFDFKCVASRKTLSLHSIKRAFISHRCVYLKSTFVTCLLYLIHSPFCKHLYNCT